MLQCPEPNVACWLRIWKKKKRNTNHCKCQRGTECSLTFIQLRLHTAGRAATLNIPPSARVPSEHLDLQLVIDNADNKKKKVTCVHQSKLANESQNAVHIHIWNTAVLCQPAWERSLQPSSLKSHYFGIFMAFHIFLSPFMTITVSHTVCQIYFDRILSSNLWKRKLLLKRNSDVWL